MGLGISQILQKLLLKGVSKVFIYETTFCVFSFHAALHSTSSQSQLHFFNQQRCLEFKNNGLYFI